jgi:hypothetical protein
MQVFKRRGESSVQPHLSNSMMIGFISCSFICGVFFQQLQTLRAILELFSPLHLLCNNSLQEDGIFTEFLVHPS